MSKPLIALFKYFSNLNIKLLIALWYLWSHQIFLFFIFHSSLRRSNHSYDKLQKMFDYFKQKLTFWLFQDFSSEKRIPHQPRTEILRSLLQPDLFTSEWNFSSTLNLELIVESDRRKRTVFHSAKIYQEQFPAIRRRGNRRGGSWEREISSDWTSDGELVAKRRSSCSRLAIFPRSFLRNSKWKFKQGFNGFWR